MPITKEEVRRIADLAKLSIQDDELERFAEQFQKILDYFTQLESVPTDEDDATYHVLDGENFATPFRDDEVRPSLSSEDALKNAPDQAEDHFRVPGVIE